MHIQVVSFVMVMLIGVQSLRAEVGPNLVPLEPSQAPNYWCTWYAQNYWIKRGEDMQSLEGVDNPTARESLNEHTLFDEGEGWATTYLPRGREDFIFLIDHGWQDKNPDRYAMPSPKFFNSVADVADFARYQGLAPQEVLKHMNQDIQALGWRSLGIWFRGSPSEAAAQTYVDWSKYAGISYWKVDGGDLKHFWSWNKKNERYPELVIEYVTGAGGNINGDYRNPDVATYPSVYDHGAPRQEKMLNVLRHADTFRTYDASPLLMSTTTLRRTHDILKQTHGQAQYRAILNVQDDCNLAVGLGVAVSSKRHPNMGERLLRGIDLHHQLSGPRLMQKRINEVERLGRWSRIAQPFAAGEGTYRASSTELIDQCEYSEYDTWARRTYGHLISQSAPAVMARNMPLPTVTCDGPPPFVCATTYPNGATGIATEGRVTPENKWFEPRAVVTVQIRDAAKPIGVVGRYDKLVLECAGSLEQVRAVWAQDLLATESKNIFDHVQIDGNRMTIPGALIDRIGTSAGDVGDLSVPGLVVQLVGDDLPLASEAFVSGQAVQTSVDQSVRANVSATQGFVGTAHVSEHAFGHLVEASENAAVALRPLEEPILSGRCVVSWRMRASELENGSNGFVVLSGDVHGHAAVVAGVRMGAGRALVFENNGRWDQAQVSEPVVGSELHCRLVVDVDERTAELTVNGVPTSTTFSESLTGISFIGFGVDASRAMFSPLQIEQ